MKATAKKHLTMLAGLSLALLISPTGTVFAHDRPDRHPDVTAVTGQSDWSILPPAIPSKYVTFYADGSATIKRMPLVGNFALTGDGLAIDATIHGILSADLDPTLSGPIYGPLVVTQRIRGKDKTIFTGNFFGRVNSLLASGQIILGGHGEFAGVTIVVSFLETGANTETFVLTGHLFDRHGDEDND
jgi:hypothetical protein